jgi:hypothetical protein
MIHQLLRGDGDALSEFGDEVPETSSPVKDVPRSHNTRSSLSEITVYILSLTGVTILGGLWIKTTAWGQEQQVRLHPGDIWTSQLIPLATRTLLNSK